LEFKEVVGRRRSIRFFQPYRPVEREKIQKILEACRIASCAVNGSYLRAISVARTDLDPELRERLKTTVAATNYELAPHYLFFFADHSYVTETRGGPLRQLVEVHAMGPPQGWTIESVDAFVYPNVIEPLYEDPLKKIQAISYDCGIAICQGLLCAFDEGLGATLSGFNVKAIREGLNVPEEWMAIGAMLVGYPAESWEAGGQRPRPPFEDLFHEGTYGTPFQRDEAVVEELKDAKMLQTPAPLPWRQAELKALARMFNLPE
jgi:nitroreductase